jgi:hypothetical protein
MKLRDGAPTRPDRCRSHLLQLQHISEPTSRTFLTANDETGLLIASRHVLGMRTSGITVVRHHQILTPAAASCRVYPMT